MSDLKQRVDKADNFVAVFVKAVAEGSMAAAMFVAFWLPRIFSILLIISFFVVAPLCIFKSTRKFAMVGFIISAMAYGAVLWLGSLLIVYLAWGGFITVLSILLGGVGPVPFAILVDLLHGRWAELLVLVFMIVATIFNGVAASHLADEHDRPI